MLSRHARIIWWSQQDSNLRSLYRDVAFTAPCRCRWAIRPNFGGEIRTRTEVPRRCVRLANESSGLLLILTVETLWRKARESNSHPCGAPVFRTGVTPCDRTFLELFNYIIWSAGWSSKPLTTGLQSVGSSTLPSSA